MLYVSFILPPSNNAKPFRQVPLTSLYLLTVLKDTFGLQVDVSVIDLRGVNHDSLRFYIPERDVYFYTITSPEWEDALEVLGLVRSLYPQARHVAGGIHVFLFQEEALRHFDSISIGEGEVTIVDMISDLLHGRELRKTYSHTSPTEPNDYPYPDRSLLPKPAVVQTGLLPSVHASLIGTDVLFSRWCPFQCAFCATITMGKTVFRSPSNIEAEIEYLKREYGVQALVVKDDNGIPFQHGVAPAYLRAIARTNVKWRGQSRANEILEEHVRLAAESGCTDIAVGIESASQRVLKIIDKRIDLDAAKRYIGLLKQYGIGVRVLLILGLPGEDVDIYQQTIDFVAEVQPTSVVLALFSPYPGSPIAQHPEHYGMRLIDHEYRQMRNYFGRLDKDEKPRMFYEYLPEGPWGKALPNATILRYYEELQTIFREQGLNF